ncbi:MAG: DEAD/DEAH box helicase, partial [Candidatus Marsarchaeota archaeon]|nr:DEAD/DEAH box helicase [Candidatus Marsarchaeota archaeon]
MVGARSAFIERVGRLNKLQEDSFGAVHDGVSCLITAPTGSGKTEAAVIPILEKAAEQGITQGIFALYITPLRALNRDMMKRLSELCAGLRVSIGVRHGDTSQDERRKQALSPPMLMITTPESIQNMLLSRRLRESFRNLRYVVVDELHELYHNKRGAQLSVALERLAELSQDFARVGLSATVGDVDEAARFLFNGKAHKVIESDVEKRIDVSVSMPLLPKRKHSEFEAAFEMDDASLARIEYLEDAIKGSKATLVFANTRQVVESLGSKIIYLSRLEGFDYVGIHHSSLDKEERIEIENTFKSGKINCIIATSSLELGIDIGRIDMVVQYSSPRQASRLLQRLGRGGHREGEVSRGAVVVSGALEALESAATIISAREGRIEEYRMEEMALDVVANQLSSMALEYRDIDIGKAYRIFNRSAVYSGLSFEKFSEVVGFCNTIGTIRSDGRAIFPGRRTRNYAIENIGVIPDSRRFAVKRASTNRIISTLDERFVYSSIDEDSTFITKGVPWRVISIDGDMVLVEQSDDLGAAVPDWEGEDLPVPQNIAQKTMELLADHRPCRGILDEGTEGVVAEFSSSQRG